MTRVVPHTTARIRPAGAPAGSFERDDPVRRHTEQPLTKAQKGVSSQMAGLSNDNLSHGPKRAGHHAAR